MLVERAIWFVGAVLMTALGGFAGIAFLGFSGWPMAMVGALGFCLHNPVPARS